MRYDGMDYTKSCVTLFPLRSLKKTLVRYIDIKLQEKYEKLKNRGWYSKGTVLGNDQTSLKENGVSLNSDFLWCQSIFWRISFTKRQATTEQQPVSPGFLKEMGFSFHRVIKGVLDVYDILDDLVINIDQTPLSFILLRLYAWIKRMKNLCR